jgi:hypothetical protein
MVVYNYNPSRRFVSSRPDPVSKKKKNQKTQKNKKRRRHKWLTSVIPATPDAEIRRIAV